MTDSLGSDYDEEIEEDGREKQKSEKVKKAPIEQEFVPGPRTEVDNSDLIGPRKVVSEDGNYTWQFGVIDFLTAHNAFKTFETTAKSLIHRVDSN